MKIEILPAAQSTALAILSLQHLDNRELNPAIEKQLVTQNVAVANPQSALADLIQLIDHRHPVGIQAWDMTALNVPCAQVRVNEKAVTLVTPMESTVAPNLNAKSSRVLIVIGSPGAGSEVVHATGQELQRKIKAFFGIQARLQFRTCNQETQSLETTKTDELA
ncbi:hypothetical protein [Lactiplantibacillus xiangfangensis]|uniref:Uncharacterized protein n=1 Tax=Lactiplantibacillus xiangfangensis TaxID=942150 RepID=A0A0R2M1V1_9LACO|nr:hypothetical protein [Lactiplantibacillus xiangfangensis]KRO08056.1 hypothetical protein IV64_GL000906 [Lactiplantibacillus xiangfangensis]